MFFCKMINLEISILTNPSLIADYYWMCILNYYLLGEKALREQKLVCVHQHEMWLLKRMILELADSRAVTAVGPEVH